MNRNKGITLISLIVIILVLLILISVTIYYGGQLIDESKKEDIVTTMLLIESKTKVIKEKYDFEDIDSLVGTQLNINEIENEELKNKLNGVENSNFYKLSKEDLEGMGITEIDDNLYYIVDYNSNEIYYPLGYDLENNVVYSLSEIDSGE